jgi:hypothetical protein
MDTNQIFAFAIAVVLALVLGKLVSALFFEIPKRNRYMEAEIRLLAEIAAASGVSTGKIAEIVADAQLPQPERRKLLRAEKRRDNKEVNK